MLALVAVFTNYVDLDEEHFWHFFTNQSSLLAGIVLVLGGTVFTHRHSPLAWDIMRGTAVMMMLTTGVVYAVLLDGVYNPFDGSHRWPSSVMHQLLPVVLLVDILLVPLHRSVPMWSMSFFTVYPLGWLGFTLWYGNDGGWYPYDFLNPDTGGGVTGVAITIGAMVIAFLIIAWILIRLGKVMRTGSGAEPLRRRVS
jgi:hypothetical protein